MKYSKLMILVLLLDVVTTMASQAELSEVVTIMASQAQLPKTSSSQSPGHVQNSYIMQTFDLFASLARAILQQRGDRVEFQMDLNDILGRTFTSNSPPRWLSRDYYKGVQKPEYANASIEGWIERRSTVPFNLVTGKAPDTYLPFRLRSIQYNRKYGGPNFPSEANVKLNSDSASIQLRFGLVQNRWILQDGALIFLYQSTDISRDYCIFGAHPRFAFEQHTRFVCSTTLVFACKSKPSEVNKDHKFVLKIHKLILELGEPSTIDQYC